MTASAAVDVSTPGLEAFCGVDKQGAFLPTKLSTAYQLAPDSKSVTFTLRKGIKFHDGTDFNATAAKWNLEQMKKARIAGTDKWSSVDMIDDYTVRINLKQYTNTFIGQLASISRISSPNAFEKYGIDKIHTYPVGTGPFKFVSQTPDVSIFWERNDDYWGGKPYLDRIETYFMTDDTAKSAALQSKGVDIIFNLNAETGIHLRSKGYNVTAGGQENLICLVPDSANLDSPLSNLKVRQAVDYALDKDSLAKLGNGFWTPLYQASTPNTLGFIADFKGRQYDPDKAKQLLTEAGYPNGFKIDIIAATTPGVTPMDTMVAMQQYLNKVGITVDLQMISANQRADYSMKGWHNGFISLGTYSSLNYLDGLSYNLSPTSPLFISAVRPNGFGELLSQATGAMDISSLAQYSQKIDLMLCDNVTINTLWVAPQQIYVQESYVHDAGLYSTGSLNEWSPDKAWISK
jgi:peptide/nickel transport system substrate-binding protein